MLRQLSITATVILATVSINASATQISYNDIVNGSGAGLDFSATSGNLTTRTIDNVTGAGVSGPTGGDELGIGESITGVGSLFVLKGLSLVFLYDGPEYDDVQEIAKITGTGQNGTTHVARLTNTYVNDQDTAVSLFVDGIARNDLIQHASPSAYDIVSEIALGALFGDALLTALTFEADTGACGAGGCSNPSDYAIHSIDIARATTVPEPRTLVMLTAGLLLIGCGLYGRRRSGDNRAG